MSCFGADIQRLPFPPFSALTLLVNDRKDIRFVRKILLRQSPNAHIWTSLGTRYNPEQYMEKARYTQKTMKKALRETQTLCAGCSKAEPKIFAPPQTPFPGMRDGQNLISWRWSLPLPIKYKPSLVRIDAPNFELSW